MSGFCDWTKIIVLCNSQDLVLKGDAAPTSLAGSTISDSFTNHADSLPTLRFPCCESSSARRGTKNRFFVWLFCCFVLFHFILFANRFSWCLSREPRSTASWFHLLSHSFLRYWRNETSIHTTPCLLFCTKEYKY